MEWIYIKYKVTLKPRDDKSKKYTTIMEIPSNKENVEEYLNEILKENNEDVDIVNYERVIY
jgi:DNA-binding phage protein